MATDPLRSAYEREATLARYLRAGLQVARRVASAPGPAEAYKIVLPALCPELGCRMARLWLREPGAPELVCVDWWAGDEAAAVARPRSITCRTGDGLAGECWAARRPLNAAVSGRGTRFPNHEELRQAGILSAAAVPFEGSAAEVVGVLTLFLAGEGGLDDHELELLHTLGDAIGAVVEAKQRDHASREQLRRSELLLDTFSAVASAGGYRQTLGMLAASAVPGLGDLCLIDVVTPEGKLERAAAVHADPAKAHLVEELKRYYPPEVGSGHPADQVTASARSAWSASMPDEFLRATTRDQRHYEIVKALGFTSYLSVPLRAGDEVLGAITLISAGSGRVFTQEDLATGERLADQIAGTMARARELETEQQRLAEVEARTGSLLELGTALSAAHSVEDVLDAVMSSPTCSLGATVARIAVPDQEEGLLRVVFTGAFRAEMASRYHLMGLDAPTPIAEVFRSNRRMTVRDTTEVSPRFREALADWTEQLRGLILDPLRAEDGSVLGVFGLSWPEPRSLTVDELALVSAVTAAVSRTIARILVAQREHEVAASLQERLLSVDIGSNSVILSTTYRPAGGEFRVGGDWYTARSIGKSGRIGISVGDVVGHGLGAVTTMSQLRSALDIAAVAESDPAAVLSLVDTYSRGVPDAVCATVAYASVDPAAHTVRYACAGHPYPLIVLADGEVRLLTEGRMAPLGTQRDGRKQSGRADLPLGALLVLYSDGLIERHGESLLDGLERLRAAAGACAQLPATAACEELLRRMAGPADYRDDVVVVALRPVGTIPQAHVDCLPASFDQIPPSRWRLRRWLEGLDLDPTRAYEVLLAVGEAVNNAIEHASRQDSRKLVGIEAFASPGWIAVSVTDSGSWSKDTGVSRRTAERGHGLTLIHGLSYNVETVRSSMGTRVTMTFLREGARAEVGGG